MTEALVNSLLFKPPKARPYQFPTRKIGLVTRNGERITATYIKARGANVSILYSHGNAEDLNTAYSWMRRISRELNVNVMGYDYTGYGLSTGKPSEQNCYADIEAVFEHLRNERELSSHQIVLYGRSLGSGPSCYLAAKTAGENESVGGLILHSPFTSVYRVVMNLGFTVVGDKFSNIDQMKKVICPVLICHGKDDHVVPFSHGVSLQEAVKVKAAPCFMENVGHNDHGPAAEACLLQSANRYLDYHILARRLWMKPVSLKRFHSAPTQRKRRREFLIPRCEV